MTKLTTEIEDGRLSHLGTRKSLSNFFFVIKELLYFKIN